MDAQNAQTWTASLATGIEPKPTPIRRLLCAAPRCTELGYGYYAARTDTGRKLRNHIRQIQAVGFDLTLTKVT